ncbi:PREDICTED: tryptophan synthase beta chain 2, chloroplastic-like [Nelumbo nucifera]|uniref:tryptophan synthase n=2 Tax=Nelumbo nucifera TaxID=4432 RepID=A0A1U8BGU4_NELNU|nr:PREDICTED: tryptophan synthase beta chain 2, chloroplastic-like [Nelumbo nucifera]
MVNDAMVPEVSDKGPVTATGVGIPLDESWMDVSREELQGCNLSCRGANSKPLANIDECVDLTMNYCAPLVICTNIKEEDDGRGAREEALNLGSTRVGNLETSFYLTGTVVGPHPLPIMVREFQSVIGKEIRRQAMEKWGGKPDILVACVGSGSNAMGLFHEFIGDEEVRLIGVEAAGLGLDSGRHSAILARGEVGVYHGAMSYLLQDREGQIIGPHSIGVGLEYLGVGPELSFLKDTGRAEFYTVTDQEALDAYHRLCRLDGIVPALEASHALAFLEKLCPTLPNCTKLVVNCSGRGDKDLATVFKLKQGFDDEVTNS